MRFRAADLRPHGWRPPQTLQIPDWCGCSTEYLPVPVADGWWHLVPIWDPAQMVNPLRRYEPGAPPLGIARRQAPVIVLDHSQEAPMEEVPLRWFLSRSATARSRHF